MSIGTIDNQGVEPLKNRYETPDTVARCGAKLPIRILQRSSVLAGSYYYRVWVRYVEERLAYDVFICKICRQYFGTIEFIFVYRNSSNETTDYGEIRFRSIRII